jgi:hypothetical protein
VAFAYRFHTNVRDAHMPPGIEDPCRPVTELVIANDVNTDKKSAVQEDNQNLLNIQDMENSHILKIDYINSK